MSKVQTYQYSYRGGNITAPIDSDSISQNQSRFHINCLWPPDELFLKNYAAAGGAGTNGSCFISKPFTVYYKPSRKGAGLIGASFIHSHNRPRFIKLAWPIVAGIMKERRPQRVPRPGGYKYRERGYRQQLTWTFYSAGIWHGATAHQAHRITVTMKVSTIHTKSILTRRFLEFAMLFQAYSFYEDRCFSCVVQHFLVFHVGIVAGAKHVFFSKRGLYLQIYSEFYYEFYYFALFKV